MPTADPNVVGVQSSSTAHNYSGSKREKLRNFRDKAKSKTKSLLNVEEPATVDKKTTLHDQQVIGELDESPAFNPIKFLDGRPVGAVDTASTTIEFLQASLKIFINPKKSLKSIATKSAASKIANSRPRIPRDADLDFLEAHENLKQAKISQEASDNGSSAIGRSNNVDSCHDKVQQLDMWRQSMRVAWITSRHVQRVRVVDRQPRIFPDQSYFEEKDEHDNKTFKWGRWIAQVCIQGIEFL